MYDEDDEMKQKTRANDKKKFPTEITRINSTIVITVSVYKPLNATSSRDSS